MVDWIERHETFLLWLTAVSAVLFVAALAFIPWVILRLPADYFSERRRRVFARQAPRSAGLRLIIVVGKNCLGGVFVLLGLVMLLTPGQGLLTIAAGLLLMDFPGKYRVERWLISRGPIIRAINGFRRKRGREAFRAPPSEEETV